MGPLSSSNQTAKTELPDTKTLRAMASEFRPTRIPVELSHLSSGDRSALVKLVQAGRVIDEIFLTQVWQGNAALFRELQRDHSASGRASLQLYNIYKSPWSDLDDHSAYLPDVPPRKPLGANFYPEDMSADEFERWVANLPAEEAQLAMGFFTVIHRGPDGQLQLAPYSREYEKDLRRVSLLLGEAAELTDNASLRRFLEMRGAALLSNDYYESDLAWMDVDAPLDITIGPYETYNDELFGYKAAFEAYVCVTDEHETQKVQGLSQRLQQVEDNLPLDSAYRNPRLGTTMPIRVVNEVLSAGDANHGVRAAAFNLPNDERVVQRKGSKKVMLKNVQHAKFDSALVPIANAALPVSAQRNVSFDSFFTHILAHEMAHGIGPHEINRDGRISSVRLELKDLYSTIEEAKADVTGLFMVQYFFDNGILPGGDANERKLYTTFLASAFRTLRFGITEAHGRGMALQFNYFMDHAAFVANADGTFEVNEAKMKQAVRDLTRKILMIEATGNYSEAQDMLSELGILRPAVTHALNRCQHIPVDILPVFVTADELAPPQQ